MAVFRQGSIRLVIALSVLLTSQRTFADTIKDALDAAKTDYSRAQEQAENALIAAFDSQLKVLSQGGDLDAVEALIAQRKSFIASKALPTASSMRAATAIYEDALASNELRLKAAYQTAIADYTKAQHFDDAVLAKRLMIERFPPVQPATQPTIATAATPAIPADPILDALQLSKRDFKATVEQAHAELLGIIEKKANDAADKGDLDSFTRFNALEGIVLKDIVVPSDFKDTAVQSANARFVRTAETAYSKLKISFQLAISDYTKARKIEQAEAVKTEMSDGGWFQSYSGEPAAPSSIDLLNALDLQKNTVRRGWQINNGVLEPTAGNDEHGPWLEIPVSAKGSYELQLKFTLATAPEAIYVHVPVGKKWALLVLAAREQTFEDIQGIGQIFGHQALALSKTHEALFRVIMVNPDSVKFELVLDNNQALSWSGPADKVTKGAGVWDISDNSCFAVGTKSGTIVQMQLKRTP